MAYQSSIKLTKVVERFELEVLNAGKNYDHCLVRADDITPQTRIFGPTWPEVSASLCSLFS